MAGKRKLVEPQSISQDELPELKAKEFARLARQTGWRLAWLVVSSCQPGTAGRPSKSATSSQLPKMSLNQFAKLTGKGRATIQFYYKAWDLAYKDGTTPCAAKDVPADVEWVDGRIEPPDEFQLDDDDLARPWDFYFDWAKTGNRPNPKRYQTDSEDEEPESEDEEPESEEKSNLEVVDDEDDSESIDEDFGLPAEMTEDEVAEVDSSLQREQLLEVLETLKALSSRVSEMEVSTDNGELLVQIASAALDLNGVATALAIQSENEERVA